MTNSSFRKLRIATLAILVAVMARATLAHHSQSQFDLTKTITLEGTVSEVDWANPHTFFYIDAKEAGAKDAPVKNWGLEGQSPNFLMKNGEGWKPDTLKVGEKVTMTGNPRKDGKPTMLLLEVKTEDGKHYTSKSPFNPD
jgi:Family of unknown function (DUF6152)